MNAIIALCQFCESHGPRVVFCTQTLRDTKLSDLCLHGKRLLRVRIHAQDNKETDVADCKARDVNKYIKKIDNNKENTDEDNCNACEIFTTKEYTGLYSEDATNGATFLSTHVPIQEDIESLLNGAAIRSLSSDANPLTKNGGFVFYGNTVEGYVLSHTFHLNDAQARGFFQLFSIIIIMKDKYYLLNAKPFLAQHLQMISLNLVQRALNSGGDRDLERSIRSKSSRQQFNELHSQFVERIIKRNTPRSLIALLNDEDVFHSLHQQFSWLLINGAQYLSEYVPEITSTLPTSSFNTQTRKSSKTDERDEENILSREKDNNYSIRYIRKLLGDKQFPAVCYCILTGVKVIISGKETRVPSLLKALKHLLPELMDPNEIIALNVNSECELLKSKHKILTTIVQFTKDTRQPLKNIYYIQCPQLDMEVGSFRCIWFGGSLPDKLPELLQKLVKGADEVNFNELVLNKHTNALIEEWKNKMLCWKCSCQTSSISEQRMNQIKNALGIQVKDLKILDYWIKYAKDC